MKKLIISVDMYGCPNKCKHCWIGQIDHNSMENKADEYIVNYFKPFFDEITFYSWLREPDIVSGYEERWERDKEISVNSVPERFELGSFYRLSRDANYAKFLKGLGVKKVQLTFFGLEEMTDKYVGRKGAFKELIKATDILLENGIAPRYQAFINQENKEEVAALLDMIKDMRLEERCQIIGIPFEFVVHEGSCEGENKKLYNIRICKEEIPQELIKYYHGYTRLLSEKECCELLENNHSPFVYHNDEDIVLYITSNFDVYFNFTNISPNWKIGNMKNETAEVLVSKILQEDTFALNMARNITLSELVTRYGDFQSNKAFSLGDYKGYLLNCYVESMLQDV